MKKLIKGIILMTALVLLASCGPSISVTDAWVAENVKEVKNETFLVMARTDDRASRQIFENEIAAKLRAEGVDAVESYTKYPSLNLNEKGSEADIAKFVSTIMADGFEGVVLTVLKDKRSELVTEQSGGYYTGGGGYPSMYGGYGGFGGYYGSYYSPYGMRGSYVPATERTYTSEIYKLETVVYDLRRSANAQLISVVGVEITDPVSASEIASGYAKKVVDQFK